MRKHTNRPEGRGGEGPWRGCRYTMLRRNGKYFGNMSGQTTEGILLIYTLYICAEDDGGSRLILKFGAKSKIDETRSIRMQDLTI